jgi:hypothetical protein
VCGVSRKPRVWVFFGFWEFLRRSALASLVSEEEEAEEEG